MLISHTGLKVQDQMQKNYPAVSAYDVVIVGAGVSGLYAALNIEPSLKVLVVAKRDLELSNSTLAQGGIAAVLNHDKDSREQHIRDTLIAGGNKNNLKAVETLVDEGPKDIRKLIELGVDFDRDSLGMLHMTLEGGHSINRIVHHKDTTGLEVVQKLAAHVIRKENITVMENAAVLEIGKIENGFCFGILKNGTLLNVCSRYAILATGGIGRVYKYTTNSKIATGDGIVMAHKLGAKVSNISLIQFHPTAFAARAERERFLISESVRGEGAILLNCRGERFMPSYDNRGELAPRDVVSHAIMEESKKTGSEDFYLDITSQNPEFVKKRFPGIYSKCLDEGIDITKDKIPVFPCQHYLMGGIDVDTFSRTSLINLYAVGECSHTGVHGNNRLASNSLLEALVFSRRAACDISAKCAKEKIRLTPRPLFKMKSGEPLPAGIRSEVRSIVQDSFFVNPNLEAAKRGLPRICEIDNMLENINYEYCLDLLEAKSLVKIAKFILTEILDKSNNSAERIDLQ